MFYVAVVKQHVLDYLPIVLSVDHISRKIFKKKQYEVFVYCHSYLNETMP
jgi:peptide deformylase